MGFLLFLVLLIVCLALVERPVLAETLVDQVSEIDAQVEMMTDRGTMILRDGRQVCLAGLRVSGGAAKGRDLTGWRAALDPLLDAGAVRLKLDPSAPFDRYGCLTARVETADGVSLQHVLLEKGLAAVDIASGAAPLFEFDDLLAIEDEARRAKRGIWRRPEALPKKAAAVHDFVGSHQIVEGRVRRVSSNDRYVYLNFGADWRTDFTVRLRRKFADQHGLDPDGYDGRRLRIRGFVQESRGPLIDISHPKQIEILP